MSVLIPRKLGKGLRGSPQVSPHARAVCGVKRRRAGPTGDPSAGSSPQGAHAVPCSLKRGHFGRGRGSGGCSSCHFGSFGFKFSVEADTAEPPPNSGGAACVLAAQTSQWRRGGWVCVKGKRWEETRGQSSSFMRPKADGSGEPTEAAAGPRSEEQDDDRQRGLCLGAVKKTIESPPCRGRVTCGRCPLPGPRRPHLRHGGH